MISSIIQTDMKGVPDSKDEVESHLSFCMATEGVLIAFLHGQCASKGRSENISSLLWTLWSLKSHSQ